MENNCVEHVRVSQSSRRDARPDMQTDRSETFLDEHNRLVLEKKNLERSLAGYSKSAFLLEQQKIRARLFNDNSASFAAWLKRKSEMEAERLKITDRIREIDSRIVAIRERVKDERRAIGKMREARFGERNTPDILEDILVELRGIRELLKS